MRNSRSILVELQSNTVFIERNKVEDDLIGKAQVETDTDDLVEK